MSSEERSGCSAQQESQLRALVWQKINEAVVKIEEHSYNVNEGIRRWGGEGSSKASSENDDGCLVGRPRTKYAGASERKPR